MAQKMVDLNHILVYNEYFEIGLQDYRRSELSGGKGSDVHHIWGRILNENMKMRGIQNPNDIRNLMALTRKEHEVMGQNENYNEFLYQIHLEYLETQVPFTERGVYGSKLIKFLYKIVSINRVNRKTQKIFKFKG